MPYIKTVPPPEATGKLKEGYETIGGPRRRGEKSRWCARCRVCIPMSSRRGATWVPRSCTVRQI